MATDKQPKTEKQLAEDLEKLFVHLDEEDPAGLQGYLRDNGVDLNDFHAKIRAIVSQPPQADDAPQSADWRVRGPAERKEFGRRLNALPLSGERHSRDSVIAQIQAIIEKVEAGGRTMPAFAHRNLTELSQSDLEGTLRDLKALYDDEPPQ